MDARTRGDNQASEKMGITNVPKGPKSSEQICCHLVIELIELKLGTWKSCLQSHSRQEKLWIHFIIPLLKEVIFLFFYYSKICRFKGVHRLASLPEKALFDLDRRDVVDQERENITTRTSPNKEKLSLLLLPVQQHHCSCQLLLDIEGVTFLSMLSFSS